MPFQFLAPVAPYVNPVLKLAGGVALVDELMKLSNIDIGTNNPKTDVGRNVGRSLSNIKIGITPINDQAPPPTLAGAFGRLGTRLFNKNMTERIGSSGNAGGAQSIDPSGSGYIEPLGSYGYDELRKQWASAPRPIVQSSIPIATPVIEGMSEWEAAKKAQDMALADQLGMEIWARENPGLAAATAERARIRGTNQTDNPLMRDFRSQLPSPTDSTATTGIPATPGFQSLLEILERRAKADDGTSLVDPEKLIDPDTLLKLKDGTYVDPRQTLLEKTPEGTYRRPLF